LRRKITVWKNDHNSNYTLQIKGPAPEQSSTRRAVAKEVSDNPIIAGKRKTPTEVRVFPVKLLASSTSRSNCASWKQEATSSNVTDSHLEVIVVE
jgi:hypothetical protein